MPLETASYPKDFVTSNPAAADGMNNADDHMRMIKQVVKNALAGVSAALTRAVGTTSFALAPPDGTSTDPAYSFASETTLGIYRAGAGKMAIAGRLTGNGAVPVGATQMFLVEPAGLGKGGTGTGYDYLELDGSTWPNSAFPDLATHLGQGGTTFTLPDAKTNGRFPRSRTATVAAGTTQASQNKTHTHTGSGSTGGQSNDHYHNVQGYTGAMNQNQSHTHGHNAAAANGSATGGGSFACGGGSATISAANVDHLHYINVNSSGTSGDHTHGFSFTTSNGSADGTEARPEALSFVFCIKT